MERAVPFPLRRKLGLFALGLLLILFAVCAVGVIQFVSLRTDARRLLEESRELAQANDLDAHFESIEVLLRILGGGGAELGPARDMLETQAHDVREILRSFEGPARGEDPSRAEHEAEELALTHSLDSKLVGILARYEAGSVTLGDEAPARIEELRTLGQEIETEAREEAERAEDDLRQRSRSAVRALLVAVLFAALGLGGMMWIVLRSVVRPLRMLKQRVDQVGQGDFGAGPRIESNDEIGELARAFDEMAGNVSATQVALENRVATRTRELVRAARYADLGVLAAGVAHEINNPLATIASCAEGMQRRLERGTLDRQDETEYFRTIASEAYRARDITQRLLTLARPDTGPTTRVVLTTLLAELQRVTKHQLERRGVKLEVQAGEALHVRGNSGELLQALVNLVLNARDACRAGATVRITLTRQGDWAVLDVDDEGPGVPPELVERIFEPFFTTKPPGEGTGLGLSLVAAIIEGHGGTIVVTRAPGQGARFRVRIPLEQPGEPRARAEGTS